MGNILSGLFNFVGGAVNTLLGGNAARKDQQNYNLENMGIQQQFAEKNMAIQNKYNTEAFNAENAYNDPLAQQQRNMRAGINPNWSDGAGSVVGQMDSATPASSPSGGMPSAGNTNFLGDLFNIIQLGKDMKLKDKQIQNVQADTRLKNSEANVQNEKLPWDIENIKASTSKLLSEKCKTQQEADYYSTYLDKMFQHWEYENMSLDEQIKMARERLPYDLKFADAQTQQAVEQAAYLHVLSKYKPVEVANDSKRVSIEQLNANTNKWKVEHEYTLGLIHESNVDKMNNFLNDHYIRQDSIARYTADVQKDLNQRLGKLYESQKEHIDSSNVILGFDIAVRRYARSNHIDTMLCDLQMEAFREGIYELQSRRELNAANVDKLQTEVLTMPFNILGGMSGYTSDPSVLPQSQTRTWQKGPNGSWTSTTNTSYGSYEK